MQTKTTTVKGRTKMIKTTIATAILILVGAASIAHAACDCTSTTGSKDKVNNCPTNCTQEQYSYSDGSDFPIQCTLSGTATKKCVVNTAGASCRVRTLTYSCSAGACTSNITNNSGWSNTTADEKACSTPVNGCNS